MTSSMAVMRPILSNPQGRPPTTDKDLTAQPYRSVMHASN